MKTINLICAIISMVLALSLVQEAVDDGFAMITLVVFGFMAIVFFNNWNYFKKIVKK